MVKSFIIALFFIFTSIGYAQSTTSEKLVFGIASVLSAEESVTQYADLAKYISKKAGVKIDVLRSSNYTDMNSLIESGKVSFASICTGALLYMESSKILVLPLVDGKSTYQSYIITNKGSGISSMGDLKGKTFAFTDPISNSGTLYPKYIVAKSFEQGYTDFFSRTFYTLSHDKSIYLVNKNVVDGAAVDSIIFEYIKARKPKDVENIRIINKSPDFMSPPFVTTPDLSGKTIETLRKILTNMHNDPEGKSILSQVGIERFVMPDKSNLDIVFEMKRYADNFK